jgi:hypothetical protein
MKTLKTILIIFLTTATMAAATDDHPILWIPAVRAVDVYTYTTFREYPVPDDYGYALARDGNTFWTETDNYFNYNWFIRFDENGDVINSFQGPVPNTSISFGVACDGSNLWICCEDTAYHITKGGTVITPSPFELPDATRDISWDGQYLWAVAGQAFDFYIFAFDVDTGEAVKGFAAGDPFYERECWNIATSDDYVYVIVYIRFYSENWVYKYDKDGVLVDQQTFYPTSSLFYGSDYTEETVISVNPSSLGQIKAIYK